MTFTPFKKVLVMFSLCHKFLSWRLKPLLTFSGYPPEEHHLTSMRKLCRPSGGFIPLIVKHKEEKKVQTVDHEAKTPYHLRD